MKHCAILLACAADVSKLAACRLVVKVVHRILRKPQVAHAFTAEGVTAEQCARAEQDERVGVALDVLRSVETRLNNDIQGRDADTTRNGVSQKQVGMPKVFQKEGLWDKTSTALSQSKDLGSGGELGSRLFIPESAFGILRCIPEVPKSQLWGKQLSGTSSMRAT